LRNLFSTLLFQFLLSLLILCVLILSYYLICGFYLTINVVTLHIFLYWGKMYIS
jgi:hypothetical protein